MQIKGSAKLLTVLFIVAVAFTTIVQSAPNNASSTPAPTSSTAKQAPTALNTTVSGNKTKNESEEDCDATTEPTNVVSKNGTRQGKELTPGQKEEYKHDGSDAVKTNSSSAAMAGGEAAKLAGNSSTTTPAPATGAAAQFTPSALWANVAFATVLASFIHSAL